ALEPTRYVESDQQVIIDLAQRAVEDTSDAAEAARRIEAFVADYVTDKSLSVGYASAAEVAVSRQGDCSEHAVLAAALCRAAGIPAQVVTGLAYVPQWRTVQNGFGGHAWVQVYLADKWVGLDAAFKSAGLGGYDAGHIALAVGNGNPEDFLNLVNTMGQFKIEKVTVKKR
ncbi:MAG: transglutaminase-like domain-containing protein, partial [Sedimentisphaerales bacterium]